jgi:hypothetical protein
MIHFPSVIKTAIAASVTSQPASRAPNKVNLPLGKLPPPTFTYSSSSSSIYNQQAKYFVLGCLLCLSGYLEKRDIVLVHPPKKQAKVWYPYIFSFHLKPNIETFAT